MDVVVGGEDEGAPFSTSFPLLLSFVGGLSPRVLARYSTPVSPCCHQEKKKEKRPDRIEERDATLIIRFFHVAPARPQKKNLRLLPAQKKQNSPGVSSSSSSSSSRAPSPPRMPSVARAPSPSLPSSAAKEKKKKSSGGKGGSHDSGDTTAAAASSSASSSSNSPSSQRPARAPRGGGPRPLEACRALVLDAAHRPLDVLPWTRAVSLYLSRDKRVEVLSFCTFFFFFRFDIFGKQHQNAQIKNSFLFSKKKKYEKQTRRRASGRRTRSIWSRPSCVPR